jgi:hypothetical protein
VNDSLVVPDLLMPGPLRQACLSPSNPDATPDKMQGMSGEPELQADHCARCGEFGSGGQRWMFYNNSFPAREFFCRRCLRRMRIYAWIGFSLLFSLVAVLSGAVIWLRH